MTEQRDKNKRVVLVVEDDQPIGELLTSVINEEDGYQAIHVLRGTEALDALRSVNADLLVVDLELPGMNGFELYDKIRADERYKKVPVVFESGSAKEHLPEFRERGIAAYVSKPFDVNDVVRFVKQLAPPPNRPHASA